MRGEIVNSSWVAEAQKQCMHQEYQTVPMVWAWWKKIIPGPHRLWPWRRSGLLGQCMVFSWKKWALPLNNDAKKIIHGTWCLWYKALLKLTIPGLRPPLPLKTTCLHSWSSTPIRLRLRLPSTWLMGWQRQTMESASVMVVVRFSGNHPHKKQHCNWQAHHWYKPFSGRTILCMDAPGRHSKPVKVL